MGLWKNLTAILTPLDLSPPSVKAIGPDISAITPTRTPETLTCPLATRVTVVGRDGRVFEDYDLFDNGCTVVVQDDGRTVKVLRR